jgi:hypothetical protein
VYIQSAYNYVKKEDKMGMFKSSKSDLAAGPDVPIDQVSAMKGQGYSNNQMIQTLQRDGYTSSQIFDAMSQTEMSENTMQQDNIQPIQSMQPMQPYPDMSQQPPGMSGGVGGGIGSGMGMNMGGLGGSSNEELIEAIIDEKWNELVKDINKVIEWKQKADAKLQVMEQRMNDMKDQFDKLHQAIIGKIGDYDKNMLNVSTEMQAMEKVFSKVLPSFMDNVNELTRITDNMKSTSKMPAKKKMTSKKSSDEDDDQ